MPMTPLRVWKAIQGASSVGGDVEAASASPHWEQPVQSGGIQTAPSDTRSDATDGSQA